jgi:hypothetical protein
MASSADASRTMLRTLGLAPALDDELVGERPIRGEVPPEYLLGASKRMPRGREAEFTVVEAHVQFVPLVDAQRLTMRRGDHDATSLSHDDTLPGRWRLTPVHRCGRRLRGQALPHLPPVR